MSAVFKQALQFADLQTLTVPKGSKLLTVQIQRGELCIWYLCDPSLPSVVRRIALCGTGHPAPEDANYLGTVQLRNGDLVLHAFVNLQEY